MATKLAELLLRRKELQTKVDRTKVVMLKGDEVFERRHKRVTVSEGYDDLTVLIPKLDLKQVTAEFDFYAKQLRMVDAAIQQANWTTDVEVPGSVDVMADWFAPSVTTLATT